jgi:hypothetical protein
MLKGGFGHNRNAVTEQKCQRFEERLIHLPIRTLVDKRVVAGCVDESFLEFVTRQQRTADFVC